MNRKIMTRCYQLIKEHAELPKASEALKQRILIAANRARNRQRHHRQIAPFYCSLMVLFIVVANNLNYFGIMNSVSTQSFISTHVQDQTHLASVKPTIDWHGFNNENEFVDAFIRHRIWQTSLFRKPTHL